MKRLDDARRDKLEALVEKHEPLALKVANTFIRRESLEGDRDALEVEALNALAEALPTALREPVGHLEGYLWTAIWNALVKYRKAESEIQFVSLAGLEHTATVPENHTREYYEEVVASCSDDLDKEIVRLGREGYKREEVPKILDCTNYELGKRLRRIEAVFEERNPEFRRKSSAGREISALSKGRAEDALKHFLDDRYTATPGATVKVKDILNRFRATLPNSQQDHWSRTKVVAELAQRYTIVTKSNKTQWVDGLKLRA